ncbi:PAP2 family protein [Pandoraea captiosa]|uniref:PAP2 family protein n=2 Tax=Pandoraea captiosa TaxID=2508302 RepID=A0A5E4ZMW0_9BURK|nr:PAP2 family protein [Pandoraea captiosa]
MRFFLQPRLRAVFVLLACVLCIDLVCVSLEGLSLAGLDHLYWLSPTAAIAAGTYFLSRQRASRITGLWARVSITLFCLCLLTLFSLAAVVLQANAIATRFDLVDARLAQIDTALGFHWKEAYFWFERHTTAFYGLRVSYRLYQWQVALLPVLLTFSGRLETLADFLWLFCISVVLAILVSAFMPASNPYIYFGLVGPHDVSEWSQFAALRDGTQRTIDLNDNQGLISFPSLHAAHAVIFTYVVRHLQGLNVLLAGINGVMIIAALPFGGHYLIDIIAGVGLAITVIYLTRKMTARTPFRHHPS